jgi:anion-transporting  ArsA/GET3 family ATPase
MSEINEQEIFSELEKQELNEELIKDNKYPFEYLDKNYRIVMPNQMELTKAKQYKHRVFTNLVQEGTPLLKNWIKTLKKQDVDIADLENKITRDENEIVQLYISKAKTKDSEVKTREKINNSIEEVTNRRLKKVLDKSQHLEPTAESQAKEAYYRYLTFLCTEIRVDEKEDKWEKVWKDFESYQKDQSNFSYVALGKLTDLIYYS